MLKRLFIWIVTVLPAMGLASTISVMMLINEFPIISETYPTLYNKLLLPLIMCLVGVISTFCKAVDGDEKKGGIKINK